MSRLFSRSLYAAAVVVVLGLFFKLILTRDPEGDFFLQAGKLERSGATALALRNYELIVARHPNSAYAPRALLRIGDLLAAQGRKGGNGGDKDQLRKSVEAYVKLARSYPNDPFALTALQNAGTIAADNLSDRPLARGIYSQIIRDNGQDSEIGAAAVVKLARLSIQENDGKRAQSLLQEVLRRWNKNPAIGAEAQYFLGMCYETVFHNIPYAERAYDQVNHAYPTTQWAAEARERLGLIAFGKWRPPTRRVLLNIQPLPDEDPADLAGSDNNSLWNALRIALAARGLSGDTTLLQGYSLTPFYAGLNPDNAGEVVSLKADAWSNVAAAAGFRYTIKGDGLEKDALNDLRADLDAAHLPLVYWQNEGEPRWSLAVGYDTERGEVMLQNRGAQFDTLAAKAWGPKWKVGSPFGKTYTIISLTTPGTAPNPNLTPTPIPTPRAGQTPAPVLNGPPTFVWSFAPLKESVPIERTATRAAILLLRSGSPIRLLGAGALDFLSSAFDSAAREARSTAAPAANPTETPTSVSPDTPDGATENSIYDPTPTSAPVVPVLTSGVQVERAQKLWAFWKAPATSWIARRRNAASWCRIAALKTKDARFNRAADLFDQSVNALSSAARDARAISANDLSAHPDVLDALATQCRRARDAEREAARVLG